MDLNVKLSSICHRSTVKNLAWILTLCVMNCADNGTKPDAQEMSSSFLTSFISGNSSAENLSLASSSSSEIKSNPLSSSQEYNFSSDQKSLSAFSSPYSSSSLQMTSSSANMSSSQVVQALQFQGAQVRIPDGCGVIRWASGDVYTCVQDFWVDTVEVSIGEYQRVMGGGIPSIYHTGFYLWPSQTGSGNADDGTLCSNCPADGVTIFEAMLYANEITKQSGNPKDTVYAYTGIDTADAGGYYAKKKIKEIVALQNLVIREGALGYRLPNQGEFQYMCLKSNLLYVPWEDLYPDSSVTWLFGKNVRDLFVSPEYVPPPVGSVRHTSWFLHDLFGSAWEWTTTQNSQNANQYVAVGNGSDAISDLRMDTNHAGFRLVRGKSMQVKDLSRKN